MSELPISDVSVDLSRLPAPAFVASLSFEQLRAERLADFQQRWPGFDALVESDPAIKLIEAGAYRELLMRGAINDAGRAVMLAYAVGADLDHIAARFGVARLTITPATADSAAVLEPDEDLRLRVQLAPERFAAGGLTAGGYRYIALTAAPSVKDVRPLVRGGGRIDVVLLGREGAATAEAIAAVQAALSADHVASLTDVITVRSANVSTYSVRVTVRVRPGPDPELVRRHAEAGVRAYADQRARIGLPVYATMLSAAAAVGSVEQALVDVGDVDPGADGVALLDQLTVAVEVLR